MRLGYACVWDRPPQGTWSNTPWQLRAAIRAELMLDERLEDFDLTYPAPLQQGLRALSARRRDGQWVSMWRHSRISRAYSASALRLKVARRPCDVVIQIGDLALLRRVPYLLVQDLSFDVLLTLAEPGGEVPHFPSLSRSAVLRLRDRQRKLYEGAAGVICLSHWLGEQLVSLSGVPASKVHVVHPGGNALRPPDDASAAACRRRTHGPRRKLLSIGKDFRTKGGAQVLAALEQLRRHVDPQITLTVIGPSRWPFAGAVPEGVDFVGRVPLGMVSAFYDEHDLFVLPSRVEGFGIVFAEALARGLPCVGRRAFAMPEVIRPGSGGLLVESDSPEELAITISEALSDDALYRSCGESAGAVAAYYSWQRAAQQILAVVRRI